MSGCHCTSSSGQQVNLDRFAQVQEGARRVPLGWTFYDHEVIGAMDDEKTGRRTVLVIEGHDPLTILDDEGEG